MVGIVRIAVALMVMAAEIDVSMSVRIFEELTQPQPKPHGFLSMQMRTGVNVLTGHPGTKSWQRSYFYVRANGAAFEVPPTESSRVLWNPKIVAHPNIASPQDDFWNDLLKVMVLEEQEWASFDRQRVDRQRERIARADWSMDVPCLVGPGKRLKLPLMGKAPKACPSYGEILRAQLRGKSFGSTSVPEKKEAELQGSLVGVTTTVSTDPLVEVQTTGRVLHRARPPSVPS
ncbi:uncharacterized protein LOC130495802 [Raphanus sativus]|uniref:Uncharacterized protein LOC130495802 n=1 Tax=Raphanus sativus TaxID=3726 RepID=A0A9W3BVN9_RAPSA|nr:uncharacterized protein LOC130495802 [Raphanus sativus]